MSPNFSVRRTIAATLSTMVLVTVANAQSPAQPLKYPETRKTDQVDTYHGTVVADPYRWLEDDNSAETKAWVKAQNAVTDKFLEAMPQRLPVRKIYTELYNFERYGLPSKEGGRYFWSRNDGLQQQSVIYMAKSLTDKPVVAIDPNQFAADGTVALTGLKVSRDGRHLAYGKAVAGSDWQVWQVRDLDTGNDLADKTEWVKFSSAEWTPDGKGYFYSRYDAPKEGAALTGSNFFQKLYYHRIGTPQSADQLVYENPAEKEWGFGGKFNDKETFYTYTSLINPTEIYRYDVSTGKSTLFKRPQTAFDPTQYETKREFVTSKDGTRFPVFIAHRKGLKLDGSTPTLLYGYGGFNVSETPSYRVTASTWMTMGGVYVSASIRGGGEYGAAWHDAGTKGKKQNVFDDFIAAGEWLVANKYTRPNRLAINGGSNGGLLVGAVVNQRPGLFGAAIPQVGVMDMLRFHKFTIGWAWVSDYGTSDQAEDFKWLSAYSPIHNIRPGVNFPPILITTADHDDRVVPAHSFKYAATLQAADTGSAPKLIRIETSAGHGAGKPTSKVIEERADILSFIANVFDMSVK